jgi:hypothetical protein
LMSPLAVSVIGTSDPGTGTHVFELVVEASVLATLLICVWVVPRDGVKTAAAVAANAPAATTEVTAMVRDLRVN